MTVPQIKLNDDYTIPQLGLGLWRIGDADAAGILSEGVAAGYRSFDTAAMYGNESGVGNGIAASPVKRGELFIATKLWNTRHGYDETLRAFEESMARLKLGYLDMYLIHWPVPAGGKYVESWKAFLKLRDEGRIKSVGVSNFLPKHIERLIDETGVAPAVNQIEYHPWFQQTELARANAALGVKTECWAPLGRGGAVNEPLVLEIAEAHGKSPAQIILRWHVEKGFIVIPKSANPRRMRENLNIFDFTLSPDESRAIDGLNRGVEARTGDDPEVYTGFDAGRVR